MMTSHIQPKYVENIGNEATNMSKYVENIANEASNIGKYVENIAKIGRKYRQ